MIAEKGRMQSAPFCIWTELQTVSQGRRRYDLATTRAAKPAFAA